MLRDLAPRTRRSCGARAAYPREATVRHFFLDLVRRARPPGRRSRTRHRGARWARARATTCILDDPTVSRFHCEIQDGRARARARSTSGAATARWSTASSCATRTSARGACVQLGRVSLRFRPAEHRTPLPVSVAHRAGRPGRPLHRHARLLRRHRARRRQRRGGPGRRRDRHRQEPGGARGPSAERARPARRFSPSTAARSRPTCSRPSCSVIARGRSPAPSKIASACSKAPRAARSSSTRSASSPSTSSPSSSRPSRTARVRRVGTNQYRPVDVRLDRRVESRPARRGQRRSLPRGSLLPPRRRAPHPPCRCASDRTTSRPSPSACSPALGAPAEDSAASPEFRPSSPGSRLRAGRATCASCAIISSAVSSSTTPSCRRTTRSPTTPASSIAPLRRIDPRVLVQRRTTTRPRRLRARLREGAPRAPWRKCFPRS